jgi:hypothetical protein
MYDMKNITKLKKLGELAPPAFQPRQRRVTFWKCARIWKIGSVSSNDERVK